MKSRIFKDEHGFEKYKIEKNVSFYLCPFVKIRG